MSFDSVIVENLFKKYNKYVALEDVTFSAKRGEVLGILGSNGNGKTTLLNCITGVSNFNKGTVYIDGINFKKKPLSSKAKIGYCSTQDNTYDFMTGDEYVAFVASAFKVEKEEFEERYKTLVEDFQLEPFMNKVIKFYSMGVRQKLCIVASLISDPVIWILDEPFLGLDQEGVRTLIRYFRIYKALGKSVIVSLNNVNLAIRICDRMVAIKNGTSSRLIFNDPKDPHKVEIDILREMGLSKALERQRAEEDNEIIEKILETYDR